MSFQIPGEKEGPKRRRLEEGSGSEPMEESGSRGRTASVSSCGSRPSRSLRSETMAEWRRPDIWLDHAEEVVERANKDLEEHYGDTQELFRSVRLFKEKAGSLAEEEWLLACRSLRSLTEKCAGTLVEMAERGEQCERCREGHVYVTALATAQFERLQWALREFARRYRRVLRDLGAEEEEKEKLEERLNTQAREKRTAEQEGDQLGAGLSTRGASAEGGSSPVLTEDAIPPALLGAMERWLERRWGQLAPRETSPRETSPPIGRGRGVSTAAGGPSWAGAVGRKAGRKVHPARATGPHKGERGGKATGPPPAVVGSGAAATVTEAKAPSPKRAGSQRRRRWPALPKSAVVAVNPTPGGTQAGVEGLIKEARRALPLEELGVPPLEIKRSKMGGYLLAIKGPGAREGADRLAKGLRELPGAAGVAVSRPEKTLDIRVTGLEPGISPEAVVSAVAAAGGCPTDGIRPGAIGSSPTGMGSLWMRCPAAAAIRVAKAGGVGVGWTWAAVQLLQSRPERCFRCLEIGHLRAQCASPVDRSARCYRCGGVGHAARSCREAVPCCPLCGEGEDGGGGGRHVLGGPGCPQTPPRRKPAAETAARVFPSGIT